LRAVSEFVQSVCASDFDTFVSVSLLEVSPPNVQEQVQIFLQDPSDKLKKANEAMISNFFVFMENLFLVVKEKAPSTLKVLSEFKLI